MHDGIVSDGEGATYLLVRAQPKSSRNAIDDWVEDAGGRRALKVRVTAPPSDGAANAAIVKTLSKALGVPRSAVRIASGQSARVKRVVIDAPEPQVRAAIDAHLGQKR